MEKEIVFVTHNIGKIKSAEKYFKNLKFTTFNYELDEPRSDNIKERATEKVKQAYELVKKPKYLKKLYKMQLVEQTQQE